MCSSSARRCARRDAARALRILGGLQAEGTEPVLVLWALLRELRGAARRRGAACRSRVWSHAPAGPIAWPRDWLAGDAWDELALLAVELTGQRTLPLLRGAERS